MASLPVSIAREFCALCNWAYYCWQFHRAAFEHHPRMGEIAPTAAGHALGRLSLMTLEYGVLQVTKLHDPAKMGRRTPLSIAYIVEECTWSAATGVKLKTLQAELNRLGVDVLKPARNKAICHNDLDAIRAGKTLGAFKPGDDALYFAALQEFVNIVWQEVTGDDFPFDEIGAAAGRTLIDSIRPASELPTAQRQELPR